MKRAGRQAFIRGVAPLFLLASLYGQNCTTTSGVTNCSTTTGASVNVGNGSSSAVKANNYPVPIAVSGAGTSVSNITVTVSGLSATVDSDIDLALVSPSGAIMALVYGYGTGGAQGTANVTFSDAGTGVKVICDFGANSSCTPTDFSNGSWEPVALADYVGNLFPFPSPIGTPTSSQLPGYAGTGSTAGSATLSKVFGGGAANGTWNLYLANAGFGGTAAFTGWSISLTTTTAPATTTTLTSADTTNTKLASNTSFVGDSVTFTASVTSTGTVNTGNVTFSIDGTNETPVNVSNSGTAAFTITTLTEGAHSIIATYNANTSFSQSTSTTLTQTVDNHTTTSSVTAAGGKFCNPGTVTINTGNIPAVTATPYPSNVYVGKSADPNQSADLSGTITQVTVTLPSFNMTGFEAGAALLLVGPGGQAYELLSNAGDATGNHSASGLNITLSDTGSASLPQSVLSGGTFKPTVYNDIQESPVTYASPAPQTGITYAAPQGLTTLGEEYNGSSANGTWALYGENLLSGSGSLSGGWCINITGAASNSATTTALTSSATNISGSVYDQIKDQSVTFTATVTSGGTAVTTGTVTFTATSYNTVTSENVTTTLSSGSPNSSGVVTYTAAANAFTQGTQTITATYSGATGFGSSFATLSELVDDHTSVSGNQYCNPGTVTLQGLVTTPYPVHVFVGNALDSTSTPLAGTVATVSVSLNGFTASTDSLPDLKSLLVGPGESCCTGPGSTVFDALDFFSRTSNDTAVSGLSLTFADSATGLTGQGTLGSGTYKPSSYTTTNTYSSPAPSGPYQYAAPEGANTTEGSETFTKAFTGNSQMPNGTWSLYFSGTAGGDSASINGSSNNSVCVTVTTNPPAWAISSAHTGSFTQGGTATYTITVSNPSGPGSTAGTVTMTEIPPTGMTLQSLSGTGWTCTTLPTCTRSDQLSSGTSYPAITATLSVSPTATTGTNALTNEASISGGGASNSGLTASDPTTIIAAPVLSVTKTHTGSLTQGSAGQYVVTVHNAVGAGATSGTTTMSDSLPTGYTISSFSSGTWTCVGTGTQAASCTSTQAIGAGASFPAIDINVSVPANSALTVTNTASAYGGGDPVHTSLGTAATGSDSNASVTQTPASVSATAGASQSAKISTTFTTLMQATVKDAGSNPVPNITVTFTAPASGAGGTFANNTNTTTALTNASGIATASAFTANSTAGAYSVTASVSGATSATFSLSNSTGNPASIAATAGATQSATISTQFGTLLQATVKDAGANGVQGVTVTFTAPASGSSGTFANNTNTTTALTNASGIATATAFTANSTAGAYSVTASASGVSPSAAFSLTNNVGSAAGIAATAGATQSATISAPFGTLLQATVKDAGSNPVQGVTVTFTAPASGAGGTFANSTNSTTAVTNSSGIATASTFTANTIAGAYSVTASASGVSPNATFSLTNNAGAAASIAATTGSSQSATISTQFGTLLQATVKDASSNPVPNVTVTFTAPAGSASGTFANNTNTTTAVTNSSGVAIASAFTANTIAGSYSVTASASGVSPNAAFSLTNNAGSAASIAATTGSSQSAKISAAFATQLAVTVKDASSNLVPNVSVTFTAPGSSASGTFAGTGTNTTTVLTNSSGIATASVFTANTIAGSYSVTASASGVSSNASFALTNSPGSAASIAATAGASQSATISTQFGTLLQATVKDASSNLVPGVTVTFTAPAGSASGTFANNTNTTTAVTNASGVAIASAFTANSTAGAYSVSASAAGVTPNASFSLTNNVGGPASVAATTGSSQNTTISTQFGTQLQATVKDSGSNLVQGAIVTFSAPNSGASGTFADSHSSVTTATTNASGIATAATFTANTIAGAYSVTASTPGATSAAFSLTNNAGAAAGISATTGSGQSISISTQFAAALQATVQDASSNPVSGVTVTFTAPGSGASGTFSNTHNNITTAVTNASGIAIASAFTANATVGSYSVTASAPGVTPTAGFSLTNNAGSAASVAATAGASQSATILTAFGTQFQATVKDAGSNLVPGVTVTFTAPGSGASGTFADTHSNTTTATTNTSGVATAAAFTAGSTAGGYSVTASISGATSATFSLTNNAGTATSITAGAGGGQNAGIGAQFTTQLQATVKDAGSNLLQGIMVTFTAPNSGASGTFADSHTNSTTATTNASGIATAPAFTANGIAGSYSVSASTAGVGSSASFSLTNVGTPATITGISSTTANGSYTTGASIAINVAFNKAVNVTGAPQLALNSGGAANYSSGSGASVLTFVYVVAAGQNSARLDASSSGALLLNGGTIQDASSTAASLVLPTPGATGSLGANSNIVIDTTAPTVVSYSVQWGAQTYNLAGSQRNRLPWQITGIQVVFSKPIATANAASLSGVSAVSVAGTGTSTLTWSFSPLTLGTFSTTLAGAGANALMDAAGNTLGGGSGFSQTLRVLTGDFNDDGVVNSQDLTLVNAARTQAYNIFADINGDGVVDANDVQLVRTHLGASLSSGLQ